MVPGHSKKILILGCSTKAGTYVSKQFNKAGYEVVIYDWTRQPNEKSKYVSNYIHCDSPEINLISFEEKFLKYLANNSIFALLPLHDAALEIIRHLKLKLPGKIKILGLNEDPIYKYAHNKWELIKLAQLSNIHIPKSIYISSLKEIPSDLPFSFPCIVKPVSSAVIKEDRLYTFSVSVVKDFQELEDKVREVILNVPVMIQEFIEGYGIGFNFIAKEGELLNSYIHKRITEHNGVSSYREILSNSAYGNQDVVSSFIEKINWTGVGMLEFKIQDNTPYLMELNGRFFGSIELSVKSGLNLPEQFLELLLDNKLPIKNLPFNLNTKVRNLHDELLLNFAGLFKGKIGSFFKWKWEVLKSFFNKNDFIEDSLISDPFFVLALYMVNIKRIFKKINKKLKARFLDINKRTLKIKNNTPLNIAFVCKGNICRSPFAEVYAKSLNKYHSFFSYGSYPQENRLSPVNAVNAANHFNTSIEKHTSKYVHKEIFNTIDLFVVMDKSNYFDLIQLGVLETKIKFLAEKEILDPYKKNLDYFIETYSTIKTNLDSILKNEKTT